MIRTTVAVIDESRCIGCTLCMAACPVDAIVGARALMHTVVEAYCIGCDLCVPPCPVDCIAIVPAGHEWTTADSAAARHRARARKARLARPASIPPAAPGERRRAVAEAIERVHARRAARSAK
ncbi:MAG: RnfABCDGE type electron transport complex subunit B [Betaproteobacteria bacterium]